MVRQSPVEFYALRQVTFDVLKLLTAQPGKAYKWLVIWCAGPILFKITQVELVSIC